MSRLVSRTAAVRRWLIGLGRLPTAILCIAALSTAVMYCSNNNVDADPAAPRGDGHYRPVALGSFARGATCLAIAIVLFSPQVYVWHAMYGAWWTTPQGPGYMLYSHPMVLELLFSSHDGWLSTTPIAYLGVVGLVVGAIAGVRLERRMRMVCGALLLAITIQVYVDAATYDWWSGASFGQRRLCSVTLPLVVGLAVLFRAVDCAIGSKLAAPVRHGIVCAGIGYLVAWNVNWVGQLRHGASAGRDGEPTCCDDVWAPLAWFARPVYRAVGNPFELPASAWFALQHHVGLSRWDAAVGSYPLVPAHLGYLDGSYRDATGTWDLVHGDAERFLFSGFGPAQSDGDLAWRWTTAERAEALLPLLLPEPHRITVPIAGNAAPGETVEVRVRCDERIVASVRVGASWTALTFETDGEIGNRRLVIEASPRPYRSGANAGGPGPPPSSPMVGVAIGRLSLALPPAHHGLR